MHIKLASFKEEQLPYRSCAAIHVGAAVLAQVARSRRSEPLLDERSFKLSLVSVVESFELTRSRRIGRITLVLV